jgi:hypothetical protein
MEPALIVRYFTAEHSRKPFTQIILEPLLIAITDIQMADMYAYYLNT